MGILWSSFPGLPGQIKRPYVGYILTEPRGKCKDFLRDNPPRSPWRARAGSLVESEQHDGTPGDDKPREARSPRTLLPDKKPDER